MGRCKRWQYWLLGIVTLVMCWGSRPAIAHMPSLSLTTHGVMTAQASPDARPSLEQQAQTAYDRGQYQAAVVLLQQARQQYQTQGQTLEAAIALSNLSLSYQQLGDWGAADQALKQARTTLEGQTSSPGIQAQLLDVQGQLQFAQGQLSPALETWQRSAELYSQLGDTQRLALSRLHQARALQAQGLFQQVFRTLNQLAAEMADEPDSAMKASVLRQLGDSLRATGRLEPAATTLQSSLTIAQRLAEPSLIAASALSLGNLEQAKFKVAFQQQERAVALTHVQTALSHYQQVVALVEGKLGIQARLNTLQLLTHPVVAQWDTAIAFYPTVAQRLSQLPSGRRTVYGYTGLAETLITLKQQRDRAPLAWSDIADLLVSAQAQAEAAGDIRAQSLVLGTLGHVYEQTQQWSAAAELTRRALTLAQQLQADDITYRWYWQLGRVLKAQAQSDQAIAAYTDAFETLKQVRSDLVTANPDIRFSFRDSVEPIYRELVDLLLASVPSGVTKAQTKASTSQQARLEQARLVMEALQLAELENFFQAACIDRIDETVAIDQVVNATDTTAAVLYTIVLADRLEVVLKVPQQTALIHYAAPASRQTINTTLRQFRAALTSGADPQVYGRQLYDWLLQPAVAQGLIAPEAIETLIFVLDGDLRLIPMATLHDGQGYLVETYALSLILGLEVRDPQPLPPRDRLQVLAAGLTTPPETASTYGELPNVNAELDKIAATELPATFLRDDDFTQNALDRRLQDTDYSIVHIATHGQFGSDRQDTFILAADAPITIETLGDLFSPYQQPDTRLEMLILSACKTATGNSREVLGIAGATVQAGARSSIATLWSVDDTASVIFAEALYNELGRPGVSRAAALRQAQLALMEQYPGRPRYWAPYVLVGSWR